MRWTSLGRKRTVKAALGKRRSCDMYYEVPANVTRALFQLKREGPYLEDSESLSYASLRDMKGFVEALTD